MKWAIGIDLGGTHIAAAAVSKRGTMKHRVKRDLTSRKPDYVIDEIEQAVRHVLKKLRGRKIEGIGLGCPGNIVEQTGVVRFSNNFRWSNVPLGPRLERRLGQQIHILNDARCAALGEFLYGCGVGTNDFALITLGTGIGGGLIADSRLILGNRMGAGEVGHHTIRPDTGFKCTCGQRGCFEAQASSRGLFNHARALRKQFPNSTLLHGVTDRNWKSKIVSEAVLRGDRHAIAAWRAYLNDLAIGVNNIISFTNPHTIALGGGVGKTSPKLLAKPLAKLVDARTEMVPKRSTRIVSAALGNDAGIVGAAAMVFHGGATALRGKRLKV